MAADHAAPECFDTPFDPGSIAPLAVGTEGKLAHVRATLEFAKNRGIDEEWVRLLDEHVAKLSDELRAERLLAKERGAAIAERDTAYAERDAAIAERDAAEMARDEAVSSLDSVLSSRIWRWGSLYRRLGDRLRAVLPDGSSPGRGQDT